MQAQAQQKKQQTRQNMTSQDFRTAMQNKEVSLKQTFLETARKRDKTASKSWFDDDDDDEASGSGPAGSTRPGAPAEEDDIDPLDAFMAGIDRPSSTKARLLEHK